MEKLKITLEKGAKGLHYGNRILLPFKANVLKAVIENDIIMDFSKSDIQAEYNITEEYTEIYFHQYKVVADTMAKYETVKLIIVEVCDNIFDFANHIKVGLHFKENHVLEIEKFDEDVLFFE